jgi:hypothetical protein
MVLAGTPSLIERFSQRLDAAIRGRRRVQPEQAQNGQANSGLPVPSNGAQLR